MPLIPWLRASREDDSDGLRLAALEAEVDELRDLVLALAGPGWLTEAVDVAGERGWRVEYERRRIRFVLVIGGDAHDVCVNLPLEPHEAERLRRELSMRLGCPLRAAA